MTLLPPGVPCALCDIPATVTVELPRRTLVRGADPDDSDYSVTVILPDLFLCADHAGRAGADELTIGWCDDERCRRYGEAGTTSPCGSQFTKLARGTRTSARPETN